MSLAILTSTNITATSALSQAKNSSIIFDRNLIDMHVIYIVDIFLS